MSQNKINRSEIVFMYDVKFGNPNGDPLDENRPRIDEATHRNIISDVRLKRTIRDYLYNFCRFDGESDKGDIFVRQIENDKGDVQKAEERAKMFKSNGGQILSSCIDIRLFGGVIPLGKGNKSIQLTGPVQFKIGSSLHEVDDIHVKGTGAFASSEEKTTKTFREEYVLPYSFILFEGIVNENNAKKTCLTSSDTNYLLKGLWNGTKMLITRSKYEHTPRVLIKINYKTEFHIGDLDSLFSLKIIDEKKEEIKLRGINEFSVNLDKFLETLEKSKEHIQDVEYLVDERVLFTKNDEKTELKTELQNFNGKLIKFEE